MSIQKVLVVDDSLAARKIIIQHLKCQGLNHAQFSEAKNGEEGLNMLGQEPFDLMLTDINMPVMDGYTMLRLIDDMSLPKKPAVLLVSSAASGLNADEIEEKYHCKILNKPIDPHKLKSAIVSVSQSMEAP